MRFPFLQVSAKKKRRKKPRSAWESQAQAAIDRRFYLLRNILIAVAAPFLVVVILVGRHLIIERRQAIMSRPRVVNSRPPVLLQPFVCDLKTGLHAGTLQTFVKNVESTEPGNVFQALTLHIVPAQKVGIPQFDEMPKGDCQGRPRAPSLTRLLPAGRETATRLPEPKVILPPLLNGEAAQLYTVNCIYYSDNAGSAHASCDTYRLRLAGGNTLFICDGSPQTGAFDADPVASCGN